MHTENYRTLLKEIEEDTNKQKDIHIYWDFPGGPVVKNLPSNAGDVGSIPVRGNKITNAVGQLSLHAANTEPTRHNHRAHVLWSPRATTTESARHN